MAYAFIQSKGTGFVSGPGPHSVAFNAAVGAGRLLVVDVVGRPQPVISVTDSLGNLYSLAQNIAFSSQFINTYYAITAAGGANTVTVSYSGSVIISTVVHEYSGNAIGGVFDQGSRASGNSSNPTVLALSQAGNLIHGVCAQGATNLSGATAQSPFTRREINLLGVTTEGYCTSDHVNVAGSETCGFLLSSVVTWGIVATSFRPLSTPTDWQPYAQRQAPGPAEPEPEIRQRFFPTGLHLDLFTTATRWVPHVLPMPPLPEFEPPPAPRFIAGALFPGFTGNIASDWQPFARRGEPTPPDEVPVTLGRLPIAGALYTAGVPPVTPWFSRSIKRIDPLPEPETEPGLRRYPKGLAPWFPLASRFAPPLPVPAPIQGFDEPARRLYALFPGLLVSPWQPWARKVLPAPTEDVPVTLGTRPISGALYTGGVAAPVLWFPRNIKLVPGPAEPEPEIRQRPYPAGLLPGFAGTVPTPWFSRSIKAMLPLGELAPSQGRDEPSKRMLSPALLPGFRIGLSPSLVTWNAEAKDLRTRRHEQQVAAILNSFIRQGIIEAESNADYDLDIDGGTF